MTHEHQPRNLAGRRTTHHHHSCRVDSTSLKRALDFDTLLQNVFILLIAARLAARLFSLWKKFNES